MVLDYVAGFNPDLPTLEQQGAGTDFTFFCFFPWQGHQAMVIMSNYSITESTAEETKALYIPGKLAFTGWFFYVIFCTLLSV